jgi:hypothetical protein
MSQIAFIAMPFEDGFTSTFENGILPAIRESKMTAIRMDKEMFIGRIDNQIIKNIKESTLCIADISGSNPNVFYELAFAHSLNKPVIFITRDSLDGLPFDIRQYRTIQYESSQTGNEKLRNHLKKALDSVGLAKEMGTTLLRKLLVPQSLDTHEIPFVVAACPISYQAAYRRRDIGWRRRIETYSDHLGIRGLMQAFGTIYGLGRLPEFLDPDNYAEDMIDKRMHLYTIASPKANQWSGKMMKKFFTQWTPKFEFRPDPNSTDLMNPKVAIYKDNNCWEPLERPNVSRTKWDFGLLLRGPNPMNTNCLLMVLAGRSSIGTEATCLTATRPDCIEKLINELNRRNIDIENHHRSFCAIVSARSYSEVDLEGIANPETIQIEAICELDKINK